MKRRYLFAFAFFMASGLASYGQKVSLEMKMSNLRKFLMSSQNKQV